LRPPKSKVGNYSIVAHEWEYLRWRQRLAGIFGLVVGAFFSDENYSLAMALGIGYSKKPYNI